MKMIAATRAVDYETLCDKLGTRDDNRDLYLYCQKFTQTRTRFQTLLIY